MAHKGETRKWVKRLVVLVVVAHKGQKWLERSAKSASSWRLLVGWLPATPAREEGKEGCAAVATCRGEQKQHGLLLVVVTVTRLLVGGERNAAYLLLAAVKEERSSLPAAGCRE